MKAIPIFNPSRNGKAFCSPKKAGYYIAHGRAVMREDGTLQFLNSVQEAFDRRLDAEARAFDEAVKARQSVDVHGEPVNVVWWNGQFTEGSFHFPPGSNVQIRRIPWRASRRQRVQAE